MRGVISTTGKQQSVEPSRRSRIALAGGFTLIMISAAILGIIEATGSQFGGIETGIFFIAVSVVIFAAGAVILKKYRDQFSNIKKPRYPLVPALVGVSLVLLGGIYDASRKRPSP